MDRKDIFMSGFKSKIGYSFTYKDLNELEAIINFYEQQVKKQKKVINKAIEYINSPDISIDIRKADGSLDYVSINELLNILKEVR
jgi:hypothetical protein|nr:MAG TPA: hypothetical protein [Caudoviricetes sp.]